MSPLYGLALSFLLGLQTGGIVTWRYCSRRVVVVGGQSPHFSHRMCHTESPLGSTTLACRGTPSDPTYLTDPSTPCRHSKPARWD